MATANFPAVNTSRVFSFGYPQYWTDEDVKEYGIDPHLVGEISDERTEDYYDFAKENALNELQQKGWTEGTGSTFAEKTVSINYGGAEIEINMCATIYGGYYEGACFDLDGDIKAYSCGENWVPEYDIFGRYAPGVSDVIADDWTGNAGLNKMQAQNIIKKVRNIIDALKNEAEGVFSACAEHELQVCGHFSNGSALYMQYSDKLCKTA